MKAMGLWIIVLQALNSFGALNKLDILDKLFFGNLILNSQVIILALFVGEWIILRLVFLGIKTILGKYIGPVMLRSQKSQIYL